MTKRKIGVLGAGTWGMALARMLTVSGNEVQVWSAIEAEVDNLSTTRVHPNLPGMKIPAELQFTKSIEEVCTGKDVLLFAVPSVFVRGTTEIYTSFYTLSLPTLFRSRHLGHGSGTDADRQRQRCAGVVGY